MRQRLARWFSPETRFQRVWHIGVTAIGLVVLLALLGNGLYNLLLQISQSDALNARASLEASLHEATTRLNAPVTLLDPIRTKEQQATKANDRSLAGWQDAAQKYTRLDAQVRSIIAMPASQARVLAQKDLDQFQTSLATLVKGRYADAAGYQGRYQRAQTSYHNATTTRDYFLVADFAQDQVAAIAAYGPTNAHLQELSALIDSERKLLVEITGSSQPAPLLCADGWGNLPSYFWTTYDGLTSYPAQQPGSQPVEARWLATDQAQFHAAQSAQDYARLNHALSSQITQVQATSAALMPSVAAKYLSDFKADISVLQNYERNAAAISATFAHFRAGSPSLRNFTGDISTFQKHYDADAQLLTNSPSITDYSAAVTQIQKDRSSMTFPVIYAKTYSDIVTLGNLIAQGQAHSTLNPADGRRYPDAYEYADMKTGIGDIINPSAANPGRLYSAHTTSDFQYLDRELQMFIVNIQAMLKNLNDPLTQAEYKDKTKGWTQPHQTDADLMHYYGVTQGKVIVVSLREQAVRLYDNGTLVKAFQVTTGAMDLPSVPGINCTLDKEYDTIFKSPDKPGDPQYYQPTHVNYAMIYHLYGYEIHDAWWRNEFGLYTNLPHHDPAAFNGGSHGCVNVATVNMKWIMSWVSDQDHTPLLIY
jgi:hypothetical protein